MKYLKNLAGLMILLCLCKNAHTQTANFNGWLATFYTVKINPKLDVIADAQFRSGKQVKNMSIILLRPALSYKFNKTISAAVGYALNDARRDVGQLSRLIPEHRIWQHVIVRHKIASASSQHRFRLEQRFIPKVVVQNNELRGKGYNQAHRFRYFTRTVFPLKKTKQFTQGPFASLQNEIFLNLGNKSAVNKRVFDQNRLYGAVGYRLSPKLDLETGYMNQYAIAANGGVINNHILQVATYLNL